MNVVVIGKGILGLSIAEFLSRSGQAQVQVLSSTACSAASSAAAANLATKAQVFARDPHFDLKIRGKKIYRQWLVDLRKECGEASPDDLSLVYCLATGRDVFDDANACNAQWQRVVQPVAEIVERGFQPQKIARSGECSIEYADEAWVDAQYLLALLEKVCRARGVVFDELDVAEVSDISAHVGHCDHLILSAGAWTPRILSAWGADSNCGFLQKRRWSFGGTLEIETSARQIPENISLFEVVSELREPAKLTFSGNSRRLLCSSISVKCADRGMSEIPSQISVAGQIALQQKHMTEVAQEILGCELNQVPHRFHWGMRLGFGHCELVVEQLLVPALLPLVRKSLLVAAGAHKSGFLFAPCIGEIVMQKMQAHKGIG
jgi:hypothetical protein